VKVAALYVDPRGPYIGRPDVDAWTAERDARGYEGPWPVVAHPPCGPWCRLWKFSTKQDPKLAPLAIEQIQRHGGVLEHPAGSRIWEQYDLPRPGEPPRPQGRSGAPGWSVAVDQVEWGHPTQKRTWLYIVGVEPHEVSTVPPYPGRKPTRVIKPRRTGPTARGTYASKKERFLTPPAFAEWLLEIARRTRVENPAAKSNRVSRVMLGSDYSTEENPRRIVSFLPRGEDPRRRTSAKLFDELFARIGWKAEDRGSTVAIYPVPGFRGPKPKIDFAQPDALEWESSPRAGPWDPAPSQWEEIDPDDGRVIPHGPPESPGRRPWPGGWAPRHDTHPDPRFRGTPSVPVPGYRGDAGPFGGGEFVEPAWAFEPRETRSTWPEPAAINLPAEVFDRAMDETQAEDELDPNRGAAASAGAWGRTGHQDIAQNQPTSSTWTRFWDWLDIAREPRVGHWTESMGLRRLHREGHWMDRDTE